MSRGSAGNEFPDQDLRHQAPKDVQGDNAIRDQVLSNGNAHVSNAGGFTIGLQIGGGLDQLGNADICACVLREVRVRRERGQRLRSPDRVLLNVETSGFETLGQQRRLTARGQDRNEKSNGQVRAPHRDIGSRGACEHHFGIERPERTMAGLPDR